MDMCKEKRWKKNGSCSAEPIPTSRNIISTRTFPALPEAGQAGAENPLRALYRGDRRNADPGIFGGRDADLNVSHEDADYLFDEIGSD